MRKINVIAKITPFFQNILLQLSYCICKFFCKENRPVNWIIGVDEMAGTIHGFSKVLSPCKTVCLRKNRFYNYTYDYELSARSLHFAEEAWRLIYGPLLLGYLANKSSHFLYIWHTGFLYDREVDFKFLKSKGKKIICFFCGDDLRSPKMTLGLYHKLDIDGFVEYLGQQLPRYLSETYDDEKRRVAEIADNYADIIFSAPIDVCSYLKRESYPFLYICDEQSMRRNDEKFKPIQKIKIVHAPSSPVIKGTPLVRAAIKKLKIEGYDFDYVELQGMPNEVVLEHLNSAHIVLNQFYTFAPGLFGIEAMSNHCAVLMSADPELEPHLPSDGKGAWMMTKYWEIYDHLKELLESPEKIKQYADRGFAFVEKHYTREVVKETLNHIFIENKIIEGVDLP